MHRSGAGQPAAEYTVYCREAAIFRLRKWCAACSNTLGFLAIRASLIPAVVSDFHCAFLFLVAFLNFGSQQVSVSPSPPPRHTLAGARLLAHQVVMAGALAELDGASKLVESQRGALLDPLFSLLYPSRSLHRKSNLAAAPMAISMRFRAAEGPARACVRALRSF